MTKMETLQLKLTATRVRMGVIEGTHGAGCGHPGGSLSCADVLTYLYFREMRVDPEQPQDPARDRFVLSKGHCAPALYATLAEIHIRFFVHPLCNRRALCSRPQY